MKKFNILMLIVFLAVLAAAAPKALARIPEPNLTDAKQGLNLPFVGPGREELTQKIHVGVM